MLKNFFLLLFLTVVLNAQNPETIEFQSSDELIITADLYKTNADEAPFIIFFHRARWSRGEYLDIVPKYNEKGFNCLAVDQRSGDKVNDIINQTSLNAKKMGLKTDYLSAFRDMQASLDYVKANFNPSQLIIWGSSYSSSLVFRLAAENSEYVDGVIAFSPGEYFSRLGQSEDYIQSFAKRVKCPVFVTSTANEKELCELIFNAVSHINKRYFLPVSDGFHGSEALWEKHKISDDYWKEINTFFDKHLK